MPAVPADDLTKLFKTATVTLIITLNELVSPIKPSYCTKQIITAHCIDI